MVKWVECVAVEAKKKIHVWVLMRKAKGKRGILRDCVGRVCTGFAWLVIGNSGGPF
jgi:hypothetical protein